MEQCILCDFQEQKSRFKSLFSHSQEDFKETPILQETEHFYLTIDLHPVSDCHFLIIPKEHFTSYSLIPIEHEKELDTLINVVKEKSKSEHFILFEHGSGIVEDKLVGCGNSVFHAHLHFIGNLSYDLVKILDVMSSQGITPRELFMKSIQEGESILANIATASTYGRCHHSPYLFLKFNKTDCFVMPERGEVRIQSQFFRKIFAEELNGEGSFWDWKKGISHVENLLLRRRIQSMLNKFKSSDRILLKL